MADLIDIGDVIAMLADRVEALALVVLPSGHQEGHEWVEASRKDGGIGNSLKICLRSPRRGVWAHYAASVGGDALDLISYVMFSGDKKKAFAWAKIWLGLSDMDAKQLKQTKILAKASSKRAEEDTIKQAESRAKYAKSIWLGAKKEILKTPVDYYLSGRGINLSSLDKVPGSIRYIPSLKHPSGTFWAAMVAAINDGEGNFIAVHRTYLGASDYPDIFTKAKLDGDPRLVLGNYRGGFITLSRGVSGKSLKEAPVGDKLILCEGIEDGLSLALSCPEYRVLAAITVGNFQNIRLPQSISDVVIAADNDPVDSPARRSLQNAVDVFCKQGRNVYIARSPVGKDFNDLLQKDMNLESKIDRC